MADKQPQTFSCSPSASMKLFCLLTLNKTLKDTILWLYLSQKSTVSKVTVSQGSKVCFSAKNWHTICGTADSEACGQTSVQTIIRQSHGPWAECLRCFFFPPLNPKIIFIPQFCCTCAHWKISLLFNDNISTQHDLLRLYSNKWINTDKCWICLTVVYVYLHHSHYSPLSRFTKVAFSCLADKAFKWLSVKLTQP